MSVALITGSSGLIGSESARFFHEKGMDIAGVDNNMRQYFFGEGASTEWNTGQLKGKLRNFTHYTNFLADYTQFILVTTLEV